MQPKQSQTAAQRPPRLPCQGSLKRAAARTGLHQSASLMTRDQRAPRLRLAPFLRRLKEHQEGTAVGVRLWSASRPDRSAAAGLRRLAGRPSKRLPHLLHASQVGSLSPCWPAFDYTSVMPFSCAETDTQGGMHFTALCIVIQTHCSQTLYHLLRI